MDAGFNLHLTKPIDYHNLCRALANIDIKDDLERKALPHDNLSRISKPDIVTHVGGG